MITTVTINPCIDKTVVINEFRYGGLNRIIDSRIDPSGKGVNVAIAYKSLGGEGICTGINYVDGGNLIKKRLDGLGIKHDFVEVEGTVRTNLKIFDKSKAVITEVNEGGYPVTRDDIEKLKQKLRSYSKESSIVSFSGSAPEGAPPDIYRELIEACKKSNVLIILDTEGQLFQEGLKAQPYLVKPNLYELEMLLGKELKDHKDIVKGARSLLEYGVSIVAVSMGGHGAIITDNKEAFYSPALPVKVKSTVGAGDSMVAAFCIALERGDSLQNMLRMGIAAASASVGNEGTQLCSEEEYELLLPRVSAEKIQ